MTAAPASPCGPPARPARSEGSRALILDAAVACLVEDGYAGASTLAVQARALGEDTLQRSRRALGPDHPITLYLSQDTGIGHLVLGDEAVGDRHSRPL